MGKKLAEMLTGRGAKVLLDIQRWSALDTLDRIGSLVSADGIGQGPSCPVAAVLDSTSHGVVVRPT